MYRTDLRDGAKMEEVDFYAPEEGQLARFADGYGDMTVHEVATDPEKNLVYVSHYALGMRVLRYNDGGPREVRRVRRGRRLQLLGRRGPRDPRSEVHPGLRPRPGPAGRHLRG